MTSQLLVIFNGGVEYVNAGSEIIRSLRLPIYRLWIVFCPIFFVKEHLTTRSYNLFVRRQREEKQYKMQNSIRDITRLNAFQA